MCDRPERMTDATIYLDHAATTPVDPRVVEAMLPYFTSAFGNPSSVYRLGTKSAEAINRSRELVAEVLGADRKDVIFTSGASESINTAIKGVALAERDRRNARHVVTCATEHHATLHAVEYLESVGFEATYLPVDRHGALNVAEVAAAIRPDTAIVTLMYANNEIGTVHPIAEIGAACRSRSVPFHCDAVQAVGALSLNVDELNVDLLSMSGHKFYGPKGVGVLYMRDGVSVTQLIHGGGQEMKRRAGTENVAGIVGFATALRLAIDEQTSATLHCRKLRDRLISGLTEMIPYTHLNGHPTQRLPNNVHVTFDFIEGEKTTESVLVQLDQQGICASTGSACNSRALHPSHVLKAIGLPPSSAHSSLRLTVGRENTDAQIGRVLELLPGIVEKLRSVSPLYHRFMRERRA
jgi:cysteine desulfurase